MLDHPLFWVAVIVIAAFGVMASLLLTARWMNARVREARLGRRLDQNANKRRRWRPRRPGPVPYADEH